METLNVMKEKKKKNRIKRLANEYPAMDPTNTLLNKTIRVTNMLLKYHRGKEPKLQTEPRF